MRNPDKYTWFGIEKPFPWIELAWPVLWLYGTVREWRKPKVKPVTGPPIVRLWDKDFNYISTLNDGDGYFTIDTGPAYVIGEDFHVGEMEYPLDPFSPWIYSRLLEEWNNQHPASVEIKIGDTDYE